LLQGWEPCKRARHFLTRNYHTDRGQTQGTKFNTNRNKGNLKEARLGVANHPSPAARLPYRLYPTPRLLALALMGRGHSLRYGFRGARPTVTAKSRRRGGRPVHCARAGAQRAHSLAPQTKTTLDSNTLTRPTGPVIQRPGVHNDFVLRLESESSSLHPVVRSFFRSFVRCICLRSFLTFLLSAASVPPGRRCRAGPRSLPFPFLFSFLFLSLTGCPELAVSESQSLSRSLSLLPHPNSAVRLMVKMAAFQAVDRGSIPRQRKRAETHRRERILF
jgi:hypothetical protein